MPIARIPPIASTQSNTQIPLGLAASSGEGAAALGRANQQIENQLIQNAVAGLNRIADTVAAEQAAEAQNAVNQASLMMRKQVAERMLQTTDQQGNPTYSSLLSDVEGITESAIQTSLGGISGKARSEAERRLRSQATTLQIRALAEQDRQRQDFIRFTSSDTIDELRDRAISGELSTADALLQAENQLRQTGGAFSFQERDKILDNLGPDIEGRKAQLVLANTQDPDGLEDYLNALDENPYLTIDQKLKIRSEGSRVLKKARDLQLKQRQFTEIEDRRANNESLADISSEVVTDHFNEQVRVIELSQDGQPLSLIEKAQLLTSYRGVVVDAAADELSAALLDPNRADDAYAAYIALRSTNPAYLSQLSKPAARAASVALFEQIKNPNLRPSDALALARQTVTDVDPAIRKQALSNAKKLLRDENLDELINKDLSKMWDGVFNFSEEPIDPFIRRMYRLSLEEGMVRNAHLEADDAFERAREEVAGEISRTLGPSELSGGSVIFLPPELSGKFTPEEVTVVKEDLIAEVMSELGPAEVDVAPVPGGLARAVTEPAEREFRDRIDPSNLFFVSDALSAAVSDNSNATYLAVKKVGGRFVPLTDNDGNKIYKEFNLASKRKLLDRQRITEIQQSKSEDEVVTETLQIIEDIAGESGIRPDELYRQVYEDVKVQKSAEINLEKAKEQARQERRPLQDVVEELSQPTSEEVRDATSQVSAPAPRELTVQEREQATSREVKKEVERRLLEQIDDIRERALREGKRPDEAIRDANEKIRIEVEQQLEVLQEEEKEPAEPSVEEAFTSGQATEHDRGLFKQAVKSVLNFILPTASAKELGPAGENVQSDPGPVEVAPERNIAELPNNRPVNFRVANASELSRNNPQENATALLHTARMVFPNNENLAQLAVAQMMLESGPNIDSRLAREFNNPFGIKENDPSKGVELLTTECSNGACRKVTQRFKVFDSLEDAFRGYAKVLSNPRYNDVHSAESFAQAANAVHSSGYATDPRYASKLKQLHRSTIRPTLARELVPIADTKDLSQFKFSQHKRTMKHLQTVNKSLSDDAVKILAILESKGWRPVIAEGKRTVEQQRKKVQKGFSRTMNSKHIHGNAVDIIDRRLAWGWTAEHKRFWRDLGDAVEAVNGKGLIWGGNWTRRGSNDGIGWDPAHVEMR